MRQYATFDCGIWDDGDFRRLSAGAQQTYFMLVTQRDISPCGSLSLTMRRWSGTCSDGDHGTWLKELAEERYVLVDEDTEEVLVRTFMKWDAGYKHSKRVLAVIASALAIRSLSIRNIALAELQRLGVSIPTEQATRFGRSVVNGVSTKPTPETSLQNPESRSREPGPIPPDAFGAAPPSMFCSKHPEGTEEPCGACATARTRYAQHVQDTAGREADAKRARSAAIADCPDCDEHGKILDPDTSKPVGRCDHATLDRATGTP